MKLLKISTLVIVLVVVAVVLFIAIHSRDLPTVDDVDLLLSPVPILPESENAFYTLTSAVEMETATNRQLTDAFIAASKQTGYQCPKNVNEHQFDAEFCSLNELRDIAVMLATRASSSLAAANTVDAVTSNVSIIQMAHLLSESQGTFIEELVAMALYGIGYDALESVVASGQLTQPQTTALRTVLEATAPERIHLHNAKRSEYMQLKDAINRITSGEISGVQESGVAQEPSKYRWHPNRTTNQLAEVFRLMINGDPNKEAAEMVEDLGNYNLFTLLSPNSVGKIFLAVTVASLNDASDKFTQLEERQVQLLVQLEE